MAIMPAVPAPPAAVTGDSPLPATAADATSQPADAFVRATRSVAVGSLLAMIVLGLAWELWLAPTGQRSWALKVLPLALPLAGLLKQRMYTYRWVSLLVWLYFTEGVVRATSGRGPEVWLAATQVLLCMLLFGACAAHVRHRLAQAKARSTLPD